MRMKTSWVKSRRHLKIRVSRWFMVIWSILIRRKIIGSRGIGKQEPTRHPASIMGGCHHIPHFFVRRQVYEQLGNFNSSLTCSADYEIILRMLLKHRLKALYLPETMVRMREGGISNASLKHRWRANREDHKAWELNGLKPYFFTLCLKPFRKIFQFLNK